jgi:hypothetical protein
LYPIHESELYMIWGPPHAVGFKRDKKEWLSWWYHTRLLFQSSSRCMKMILLLYMGFLSFKHWLL